MVRAMAAPIAHVDDDPILADLTAGSVPLHGRAEVSRSAEEASDQLPLDQEDPAGLADSDGPAQESGGRSGVEEKLSACFGSVKAEAERIGPVRVITEETPAMQVQLAEKT